MQFCCCLFVCQFANKGEVVCRIQMRTTSFQFYVAAALLLFVKTFLTHEIPDKFVCRLQDASLESYIQISNKTTHCRKTRNPKTTGLLMTLLHL